MSQFLSKHLILFREFYFKIEPIYYFPWHFNSFDKLKKNKIDKLNKAAWSQQLDIWPFVLLSSASLYGSVVKNWPAMQDTGWEDLLEKEMTTHSSQYSCLEKSPGQRSLACSWGHKEATVPGVTESDMTEHPSMF